MVLIGSSSFLKIQIYRKGMTFLMEKYDLLEYFLKWLIPFVCAGGFSLFIIPFINKYKAGKKVEEIKKESEEKDKELEKQILSVQETLLSKIEENTAGIRAAILQSHLRELIIDGKMYINQKYITLEQLADYNERFLVYKSLGGNGHVDPWIKKIRELPNEPPEE